jgi:hypothetical protein
LIDAIFDPMAVVNAAAVDDPTILQLSLDAKAAAGRGTSLVKLLSGKDLRLMRHKKIR